MYSFSGYIHSCCDFQLTQGSSCWPGNENTRGVQEGDLVYQDSDNVEEGDDSLSYLNFTTKFCFWEIKCNLSKH